MNPPPPPATGDESPSAPSQRPRHHRRGGAVVYGALLLGAGLAAFSGFVVFAVLLLIRREPVHGFAALALLAVFGVARGLALLHNRHLTCTLCHGTVLSEKRCRKHDRAFRIPGLSYSASAALSVLCTGRFRCMYCGTPYRVRK